MDLPRETLISFIHKKDLEIAKLANIQNKYKQFSKDRKLFLHVCKQFELEDCDLSFETALVQETPIDVAYSLKKRIDQIRLNEEKVEVFKKFINLVFPNDTNDENTSTDWLGLRERWIEQYAKKSDSGSSFSMADEQIKFLQAQLEMARKRAPVELCCSETQTMPCTHSVCTQTLPFNTHSVHTETAQPPARRNAQTETIPENNFANELANFAQKQSLRDSEISALRNELELAKIESGTDLDSESKKEFLKNIIIQFISYSVNSDYPKMATLVPVLKQVLSLSDSDTNELASVCQPHNSPLSIWK